MDVTELELALTALEPLWIGEHEGLRDAAAVMMGAILDRIEEVSPEQEIVLEWPEDEPPLPKCEPPHNVMKLESKRPRRPRVAGDGRGV